MIIEEPIDSVVTLSLIVFCGKRRDFEILEMDFDTRLLSFISSISDAMILTLLLLMSILKGQRLFKVISI